MHDPKQLQTKVEEAAATVVFPGELSFKPMFGGITGYIGDRNFASLSDIGLALKMSPTDIQTALNQGGKMLQYEPDAPVSKTSVVLSEKVLNDKDALAEELVKSASYVLSPS